MTSISAANLRQNIYKILNDVNENSEPITITNTKGRNAVIISEDDWKAIQETIY
ncbi:MAG: type II toxin-antitoxin system Phd/YefM family antitoxin [Pseudomonadota bacterium]|nr:type II toxin-antitoxin system Phd/YefM family antitoxin [Pseudomonadota bacterium]